MLTKYPAKVSFGLVVLLFVIFIIPIVSIYLDGKFGKDVIPLVLILAAIFIFLIIALFSFNYIIEDGELRIRVGAIILNKVAIDSIREIQKTNSMLSAPAPSFDRIIITYGPYASTVIISPKNKQKFINDLKDINSSIESSIAEF